MQKASLVALVVFALVSTSLACGKERWAVKVLTDKDRYEIARSAKVMTVADLAEITGPSDEDRRSDNASNHRIADQEKTTYEVTALLLGYRKEEDGDFHLVLQDLNSDSTMIAEIPDPQCIQDQGLSAKADQFRQALVRKFGAPGKKTKRFAQPTKITLRGIGFFDIVHPTEQDGAAPNNLELHPVLGLALGS